MNVLSTTELCKIYGSGENEVHALNRVNISVERGEFVERQRPLLWTGYFESVRKCVLVLSLLFYGISCIDNGSGIYSFGDSFTSGKLSICREAHDCREA